jgi:hypothetical protein
MLRDGTSMVGRILFASVYATRLDCNSKAWRLFADVLNDVSICIEIAAPYFPGLFVELACLGSLGKAMCVARRRALPACTCHVSGATASLAFSW